MLGSRARPKILPAPCGPRGSQGPPTIELLLDSTEITAPSLSVMTAQVWGRARDYTEDRSDWEVGTQLRVPPTPPLPPPRSECLTDAGQSCPRQRVGTWDFNAKHPAVNQNYLSTIRGGWELKEWKMKQTKLLVSNSDEGLGSRHLKATGLFCICIDPGIPSSLTTDC